MSSSVSLPIASTARLLLLQWHHATRARANPWIGLVWTLRMPGSDGGALEVQLVVNSDACALATSMQCSMCVLAVQLPVSEYSETVRSHPGLPVGASKS